MRMDHLCQNISNHFTWKSFVLLILFVNSANHSFHLPLRLSHAVSLLLVERLRYNFFDKLLFFFFGFTRSCYGMKLFPFHQKKIECHGNRWRKEIAKRFHERIFLLSYIFFPEQNCFSQQNWVEGVYHN